MNSRINDGNDSVKSSVKKEENVLEFFCHLVILSLFIQYLMWQNDVLVNELKIGLILKVN